MHQRKFIIFISISLFFAGCTTPQIARNQQCWTDCVGNSIEFTDSIKIKIPYDTVYLSLSPSFTSYNFSIKFQNSRSLLDTMLLKILIYGQDIASNSIQSNKNIFWSRDTLFIDIKYFDDESSIDDGRSRSSNIVNRFFQVKKATLEMPMNKAAKIVDNIWRKKK